MTLGPTRYAYLTFNAPLSEARADALVARLVAARPTSVVDLGCGWGEFALRLAGALPGVPVRGVDTDAELVQRARTAAARRGVEVSFEEATASDVVEPADLVVCIGSTHALGEQAAEYLPRLFELVRPGGRLLLGEATWDERWAGDLDLVWDDVRALPSLAQLVELAVGQGLRPLWIEEASGDELDAFESGFLADNEEWLLHHEDAELRDRTDEHRRRWLQGYRHAFGFAYLTLGRPA